MLSIKGVQVNPQPSKMTVQILDISNAERNAQGDMLIDRIATKRKIELEWKQLTNSQMATISQLVQDTTFSVSYPDPLTGTIRTSTFYAGDRTAPVYTYANGIAKWEGLRLSLIEK